MEQRTDETARRPGVASGDTGPPADEQPGTAQVAGETAAETSGHADDGEPGWDPSSGASRDRGPAFPSPSPAYSGNTVEDGYGPPGTERTAMHDFPSSSLGSQTFGAAPAEDIYGSPDGQREYPASPYPAQVTTPRPQPQPEPRAPAAAASAPPSAAETTRADRSPAWEAATSRIPRPQQVPKRPKAAKARNAGANARQAHLMVSRFEPWSVMKFSFMISLACFVILFVAVTLLYGTLAGLGVFDAIQKALSNVTSGQGTGGVNISHWLSASTVLSYTALLGVLNVFLITAFSTVGSLVYNLTAHLIGGVEVTLRETE